MQAAAAAGYDLTPTRPVIERLAGGASLRPGQPRTAPRTPAPAAARTAPPSRAADRPRSRQREAQPEQGREQHHPRQARDAEPSPGGREQLGVAHPEPVAATQPPVEASRPRPAPDSRRRHPGRRRAGSRRAAAPPPRPRGRRAISGSVRTSGSSHDRRSISASASSHQPSTAASQDAGGSEQAERNAAQRCRGHLHQRVERGDPGAAVAAAPTAASPAPQGDEVTRREFACRSSVQRERPQQEPAPAAGFAQHHRADEAADAEADGRTEQDRDWIQGDGPRYWPPGAGSAVELGLRLLLGTRRHQHLRLRHRPGRALTGLRGIGRARRAIGGPAAHRLQRAQARAQLLADVARVLRVADHPRREEHDQLGARVASCWWSRTGCPPPGSRPAPGCGRGRAPRCPGSGRPAPRSGRSGR